MAYPIGEKASNYYKQCNNAGQTAKTYGISRNTPYLWIRPEGQTGSLKHQVKGQNAAKPDTEKLKQYVGQNPDAYLNEIAQVFNCTAQAVFYALKKPGTTRKKRPPLTEDKTLQK